MKNPWERLPSLNASERPAWTPDEPLSPAGHGLGRRLIEIHDHIREETRKLLAAVAAVADGTEPVDAARSALEALDLRHNFPGLGRFCSGYCELLTIHHTLEDRQVFPGLGTAHPGLKPVLKRLYEEHEVVAELIERLDAMLAVVAGDAEVARHLGEVSAALAEQLLSHLAYEESQLVAVLDSSPALPAGGPRATAS